MARKIAPADLPEVRGRYVANADMSAITWFRVGGPADVLYTPADEEDLATFLKNAPPEIPVHPVGVGSNLLVRDGGVEGVVVHLGKAFARIKVDGRHVHAGAGAHEKIRADADDGDRHVGRLGREKGRQILEIGRVEQHLGRAADAEPGEARDRRLGAQHAAHARQAVDQVAGLAENRGHLRAFL
jgi:hypothetical protein